MERYNNILWPIFTSILFVLASQQIWKKEYRKAFLLATLPFLAGMVFGYLKSFIDLY